MEHLPLRKLVSCSEPPSIGDLPLHVWLPEGRIVAKRSRLRLLGDQIWIVQTGGTRAILHFTHTFLKLCETYMKHMYHYFSSFTPEISQIRLGAWFFHVFPSVSAQPPMLGRGWPDQYGGIIPKMAVWWQWFSWRMIHHHVSPWVAVHVSLWKQDLDLVQHHLENL